MAEMTTRERFLKMFAHEESDRIPIIDSPWAGTLRRWHKEGMPENVDWRDYLGIDKVETIGTDISPRYPAVKLSENENSYVQTSEWGVTMRHFKYEDSTPEFLDYKVVDAESWADCKARMLEDPGDRIDWKYLEKNYPIWKKEGRWIQADISEAICTFSQISSDRYCHISEAIGIFCTIASYLGLMSCLDAADKHRDRTLVL